MGLIERVAKAIRDSEYGTGSTEAWQMFTDDAMAAIRAMRLTDNDWPENVRHYDDIAAFNDVIDIALGVAQPTEPAE